MPLQPELVTCKPPYKLATVANNEALSVTTKVHFSDLLFLWKTKTNQTKTKTKLKNKQTNKRDYGILLREDSPEPA